MFVCFLSCLATKVVSLQLSSDLIVSGTRFKNCQVKCRVLCRVKICARKCQEIEGDWQNCGLDILAAIIVYPGVQVNDIHR